MPDGTFQAAVADKLYCLMCNNCVRWHPLACHLLLISPPAPWHLAGSYDRCFCISLCTYVYLLWEFHNMGWSKIRGGLIFIPQQREITEGSAGTCGRRPNFVNGLVRTAESLETRRILLRVSLGRLGSLASLAPAVVRSRRDTTSLAQGAHATMSTTSVSSVGRVIFHDICG